MVARGPNEERLTQTPTPESPRPLSPEYRGEGEESSRGRCVEPPNHICRQSPLRGECAYVYGLKGAAQRHHCLGYGTFSVVLEETELLRKEHPDGRG